MASAEAIIAALRAMPLFANLQDEQLATLQTYAFLQQFPRGHIIFQRGDEGDRAYVIASGSIDLVVESPDGRELLLARLGPGEHFGEMALLDNCQRSASARTVSQTDLVVILRQAFLQILRERPEMSEQIIRSLVQRLRAADEKIEAFAYLDAEGRVARMILELDRSTDGPLAISHEELANMSATSRQTTTRVLGEWEGKGYVDLSRRGIMVKDPEALTLMAEL